jgi:hypothetical protein
MGEGPAIEGTGKRVGPRTRHHGVVPGEVGGGSPEGPRGEVKAPIGILSPGATFVFRAHLGDSNLLSNKNRRGIAPAQLRDRHPQRPLPM